MAAYPVLVSVDRPQRFNRAHVALRVVVLLVISWIGLTLAAFFSLLYLLLPIITAVLISQKGSTRFLTEDGPRLGRAIGWVASVYAYFGLLTDRLPVGDTEPGVRYVVTPGGRPLVGSALARLILSLPLAVILALLGIASWIIWIIAAVLVLLTERYPEALYDFQCGVLRWLGRLLAYHASLVEHYPPLALDLGPAPSLTT